MTRIAVIDRDLCNPKKCNYSCIRICPKNRIGEKCITIGKEKYPLIDEDKCIGCGLCVKKCDFSALKIVNLPEALKEDPIMQYGPNSFRLFRLPILIKGIVGLLGENGTGKTTALKILAGELKPNLGKENADWDEIIRLYRGNELQNYLKLLSANKIKTAYKAQQVDILPKKFNTIDEMDIKEYFIKKLYINEDKKELSKMSGGELQKISIASTLSKDSDAYFLDEPSSFLDIRERLKVAKVIREFSAKEEKMILVVEHDLAVLDFLADYIHIFYGEPKAFGIVSKPYSTKQGINNFLFGYIKEDNVRIREPTIFTETIKQEEWKEPLISFSRISKKLNGFSLEVEPETIYKHEVLGVFGANALGKTTFAKILAGLMDFEGNIDKKIKISYKPQYLLNIVSEAIVSDVLSTVKKISDIETIIRKLGIQDLLKKQINNLSGGELQRVAIALCLARDCDLYLLDEPSAYLDVDQRMNLIKLIKNMKKTSIIIDHDISFLSCISDRCMLFLGEPGKYGKAKIWSLKDGLNQFLKSLDITFRRDDETRRLKANKPDSIKDREQKAVGEYFASL
ncbi:MAG: ribosome biogenesis/translation initiation ATPase RLI [Candidatus Aenigmatarchaeota archaeon]